MLLVLCECAKMGWAIFVIGFFTLAAADDGASLLYSDAQNIYKYDLATQQYSVVMSGLGQHVCAFDYHLKNKLIVWTECFNNEIYSAPLWPDGSRPTLLVEDVFAKAVAVDWIHDRIYFTNFLKGTVEVVEMDGSMRKTIAYTGIVDFYAIALNPAEGFMFIRGLAETSKIIRINMDGSSMKDIESSGTGIDMSLAIDLKSRKIFWPHNSEHIRSAKFDGSHHEDLYDLNESPHGLDVYENHLYYAAFGKKMVYMIKKKPGETTKTNLTNVENVINDIKILHSSKQPKDRTLCNVNNGGCSHLCLLSSAYTFRCACPDGLNMSSDNINCVSPGASLLYSTQSDIRQFDLETHQDLVVLSNVSDVKAFDYHLKYEVIVWTDTKSSKIYSAPLWSDGSRATVLVENVTAPGLAVDWINDRIYFINSFNESVQVVEMDGSMKKTIVDTELDALVDIAINPAEGFVFIFNAFPPKIVRINMDGSNMIDIISSDIQSAPSLTIDLKSRQIFWADLHLRYISTAKFDGGHRENLYRMNEFPYGVAVYDNDLYYTAVRNENHTVHMIVKEPNGLGKTPLFNLKDLAIVKIFHPSKQPQGRKVCGDDKGGCSHLCLPYSAHSYTCACPDGLNKSNTFNCSLPDD